MKRNGSGPEKQARKKIRNKEKIINGRPYVIEFSNLNDFFFVWRLCPVSRSRGRESGSIPVYTLRELDIKPVLSLTA